MITISKCKKKGLEKQSKKLYEQLRKNHEIFSQNIFNPETVFSENYVEQAFSDLGVNFNSAKGKKWFEFYKNEWEEKFYNSLRSI
ncbi:MAG: hypothetical protein ACOYMD_03540 [Paludibacter sp.]